ncbi:ParB/RepB/Spo0J family partition protein [Emcibacter nanhaiensis]|uniref:ParB/RepB/Spo0J family partition protein n=1 Tax=Emcibacter nanhaiensis TaxID=1505037 RepID=A0A501PLQ9_9PROT|nr:ParB/RepB/Spo0J family partition protein [Emcibacter nanhaiensis]TPD61429.1 ParB/RepB/Spo0J family partition protein [Emcibacter nanhaiensis]
MTKEEKVKAKSQKGLGKGLSALLGSTDREYAAVEKGESAPARPDRELPIEFLKANAYQPRKYFDEEKARDLVESIREKGILQPILVRPKGAEAYEIIAGERRWRAAQAAGLHKVPVIVRELTDGEALEIAIIENVQRHDLTPIEEALGYQRLIDEFGHTQEKLGKIVGKSRSHIANILRLLALPKKVQDMLMDGLLSMGHARALITAENPEKLAARIIEEGLSVRQAEKIAKEAKGPKQPLETKSAVSPGAKDADTLALENDLSESLGLRVQIDFQDNKGGEVRIRYKTLEQLDDICQRLSGNEEF